MTSKELLNPRFEVIASFPSSTIHVGSILTKTKNGFEYLNEGVVYQINAELYPHLFRKMNWWECRTKEQMPKKLISLAYKDRPDFDASKEKVYNILEWNMKSLDGIVDYERMQVCSLTSWHPEYSYIPVD